MLFSFLTAVLIHETGHILALRLTGGKVVGAALSPFGITVKAAYPVSYKKTLFIDLSGPLFGILAYLLFRGSAFSYYNLFLSLFNLLPVSSLDGGKAAASLLRLFLSESLAEGIAKAISTATLILLWIASSYATLFLDASPSLFFITLWLFLSTCLS